MIDLCDRSPRSRSSGSDSSRTIPTTRRTPTSAGSPRIIRTAVAGSRRACWAESLGRWDALGVPAYLDSTNPANDHRDARLGFRPIGGFAAVLDDATVTTMWRETPERQRGVGA